MDPTDIRGQWCTAEVSSNVDRTMKYCVSAMLSDERGRALSLVVWSTYHAQLTVCHTHAHTHTIDSIGVLMMATMKVDCGRCDVERESHRWESHVWVYTLPLLLFYKVSLVYSWTTISHSCFARVPCIGIGERNEATISHTLDGRSIELGNVLRSTT